MTRRRRRLSVDFALTAAAQVAVAGSRTILFVVLARAGGPRPLADSTAVIALGTLLGLVTAAGTGPSATRMLAKLPLTADGAARRVIQRGFADSVLALGLVAVIGGGAEYAVSGSWAAWNLAVFAITYGLYQFFRAVDYGIGAVPAYLRTELLANGTIVGLSPVILLDVRLALVPFYLGYGLFSALAVRRAYCASAPKIRRVVRPFENGREFRAYAVISGVGTAASMAGLQLSTVVADKALAPGAAGSYAAAFALLIPVLYLPRALATALLPRAAAETERGRDAVRETLWALTSLSLLAALPLALVGEIFPRSILALTAGARYADGADSLRLLLLASFFLIVSVPAVNVLSAGAVRQLWIPFWASVVGLLVGVATWYLALSTGTGAQGVALGVLAGSATKSLIPIAFCLRQYGLALWPVTAGTAVVAAAAFLPRSGWFPLLVLGFGAIAEIAVVRRGPMQLRSRGLA